jgi:hypothetical protein
MIYDRRAIMLDAYRDFEMRLPWHKAKVAELMALPKRQRAKVHPSSLDLGAILRGQWKTSLRMAWRRAKDSIELARRKPRTEAEIIRDQIRYEEAAERGYRFDAVDRLRRRLREIEAQGIDTAQLARAA